MLADWTWDGEGEKEMTLSSNLSSRPFYFRKRQPGPQNLLPIPAPAPSTAPLDPTDKRSPDPMSPSVPSFFRDPFRLSKSTYLLIAHRGAYTLL